jgi:hypothetical protein
MKYSYTFISKILLLIGCIYIFYPIVDKYLNSLLNIKEGFVIDKSLVESFVWSRNTINKFNVYQNTVNLNNNQFNMSVLQDQASEEEAKELLRTGYWPWSEDTKKQYMEGVWQNTMIKYDPELALDYAMKLYNENAAKRLMSWNTKEGQFLLYGANANGNGNIIGIATGDDGLANGIGQGITVDGEISKKNIIKCSNDIKNPVLQKTTVNGYNLSNGFKNTTTVDIASEDIPNEVAGFSFVNGPCNPCSVFNENPDYTCPFQLNVKGNDEISNVWKELWTM